MNDKQTMPRKRRVLTKKYGMESDEYNDKNMLRISRCGVQKMLLESNRGKECCFGVVWQKNCYMMAWCCWGQRSCSRGSMNNEIALEAEPVLLLSNQNSLGHIPLLGRLSVVWVLWLLTLEYQKWLGLPKRWKKFNMISPVSIMSW